MDSLMNWKIPMSVLVSPVSTCSNNRPNEKEQMLPKRTVKASGNRERPNSFEFYQNRTESCSASSESNVFHEENH